MKLYVTPLSAYARIVRILVIEKGLGDRVQILEAQTRTPGSPYYATNPSGRVPHLVRDDGVGLEESGLICAYLDQLDGAPAFAPPEGDAGWELRRLEATARSLMDGLAVWGRELRHRPPSERSPGILEHERQRSRRLLALWEAQVEHPLMRGTLNLAQITLACALLYEVRVIASGWQRDHPALASWLESTTARPSFAETEAPQSASPGIRRGPAAG